MRALSIHHGEWARGHLFYEHIKEKAIERLTTLYQTIKAAAETEDMVVNMILKFPGIGLRA